MLRRVVLEERTRSIAIHYTALNTDTASGEEDMFREGQQSLFYCLMFTKYLCRVCVCVCVSVCVCVCVCDWLLQATDTCVQCQYLTH